MRAPGALDRPRPSGADTVALLRGRNARERLLLLQDVGSRGTARGWAINPAATEGYVRGQPPGYNPGDRPRPPRPRQRGPSLTRSSGTSGCTARTLAAIGEATFGSSTRRHPATSACGPGGWRQRVPGRAEPAPRHGFTPPFTMALSSAGQPVHETAPLPDSTSLTAGAGMAISVSSAFGMFFQEKGT